MTRCELGHPGGGSQGHLVEDAELLHHRNGVTNTPSLDGLTFDKAEGSHCVPLGGTPRWLDSLEFAQVGPTTLNERHSTITFTDDPEDFLTVIREGFANQFDRGTIPLAPDAFDSWHFDVIDEAIRNELVDQIETTSGPYLIGDLA
jgi:hypothetical protein